MTDQERVHTLLENGLDHQAVAAILGVTEAAVHAAEKDGMPLTTTTVPVRVLVQKFMGPGHSPGPWIMDGHYDVPRDNGLTVNEVGMFPFVAGESFAVLAVGSGAVPDSANVIFEGAIFALHVASGRQFMFAATQTQPPPPDYFTNMALEGVAPAEGDPLTLADPAEFVQVNADSVVVIQLAPINLTYEEPV